MAYRFIKDIWAGLRQLADLDVWEIAQAGAPTNGTSGTGNKFAGIGSKYINTTTGATYVNTGTKASPTWSLLASAVSAPYGIVAAGTVSSGTTTAVSIAVAGALTTDVVYVGWRVAAQTSLKIVAVPAANAITVNYLDAAGTAAGTVGTAGVLQYSVIRAS